jgi:hypothetical protein
MHCFPPGKFFAVLEKEAFIAMNSASNANSHMLACAVKIMRHTCFCLSLMREMFRYAGDKFKYWDLRGVFPGPHPAAQRIASLSKKDAPHVLVHAGRRSPKREGERMIGD